MTLVATAASATTRSSCPTTATAARSPRCSTTRRTPSRTAAARSARWPPSSRPATPLLGSSMHVRRAWSYRERQVGSALLDEGVELEGFDGLREEVALPEVAAEVAQDVALLLALDALGDDEQLEALRERDRGA